MGKYAYFGCSIATSGRLFGLAGHDIYIVKNLLVFCGLSRYCILWAPRNEPVLSSQKHNIYIYRNCIRYGGGVCYCHQRTPDDPKNITAE